MTSNSMFMSSNPMSHGAMMIGGGGVTASSFSNVGNGASNVRHLLPSIKIKTNELFYKWLSQPDRTEQIAEAINFIKQNNKVPKFAELKSARNDMRMLSNEPYLNMSGAPQMHPHFHNSINNNSQLSPYLQSPSVNRGEAYNNNNSSLVQTSSTSNGNHARSRSPPPAPIAHHLNANNNNNINQQSSSSSVLIHQASPPISRMPLSPKSPRQRQFNNITAASTNTAVSTVLVTPASSNNQSQQSQQKQINLTFNNKDQRPQSPTSPTTVQQQQQQHGPLSVRDLANEKYSGTAANNNNLKTASTTGSSAALSTSPYNTSTTTTAANKQPQPQTAQNKAAQSSQQTSTTTTTSPTSKSGDNMVQQRILAANNTNNTATSAAELIGAVNKLKPTYTSTIENNTKSQAEIQSTPKQLKTADLTTSPTSTTTATTTTTTPTKAEVVKTPGKQQQQQQQQHKHPHPYQPHHHHHQQIHVPQFYFPQGRHDDKHFRSIDDVENMKLVCNEFKAKKDGKWHREDFADLLKMLGLPCYWKTLLFRACTHNSKLNYVTYSVLEQTWSKLTSNCYDRVSLFMKLITTGFSAVYEDWEPLLQDIVDTHPGLKFLHDHKEFHTRYIKTVIARIYYTVNRSWSGKITATELRKSNFLDVLESLEYEDDINLIKDYFSYEHFYVIYCKFWELDKDHDLYISREDLYRHNNYAISARVIDRIFSGTVLRGRDWREGLMSYYDFVWFLISEEDKRSSTSVEYWFRVLDMDGDGVLSMYELEYFYNEQIEQMRERQIEYMPFNDLLCQMLDLVKPAEPGKIRLKDLKQCKMANVFFDTFINLEKYLEYEQRDPFSNYRDTENPEQSDWDKYAAEEYENLVSEDVNGDNGDMYNNYEDDFEDDALLFNNNNQSANNSNGNGNGNNNSNSPIPQQQND